MRDRNMDGQYRKECADTKVWNIEAKYGVDFGVRNDMKHGTLRNRLGDKSLTQILKEKTK